MVDVTKAASDSVHQVQAAHDANTAFNTLQDEINTERTKLGANSADYKAYVKAVQGDLQGAGLLPEMTVEWVNHNQDALKLTSNHSGKITEGGINQFVKTSQEFTGGTSPDAATQMFADSANKNFDSMAHTQDGPWHLWGSNQIGGNDIQNDLTAESQLQGQDAKTLKLMTAHGGPDAVFNLLDTAQHGGTGDGKIGQGDINAFVNDKGNVAELKAMGYTDQQITDLKSGLKSISDNWGSQSTKDLQDGGLITQSQIAKAYGFNNFSDFAKFEQTGSAPSTTSDTGSGKPKPQTGDTPGTVPADVQTKVYDALSKLSVPPNGGGYIKVAAELLGKPNATDSDPQVKALYPIIEKITKNATLDAGKPALTPAQIEELAKQSSDFQAIVQAAEKKAQSGK